MGIKHKVRYLMQKYSCGCWLRMYGFFNWDATDVFDGRHISYNPNSDIGNQLYFTGEFETQELTMCEKYLTSESVVLDVGANIGIHSVFFADKVKNGLVLSFEPSPDTFQILLKNVKGISNVIPINIAASNTTKITDFYIASDNAFSSLKDTKRKEIMRKVPIVSAKLDDLLLNMSLERVDFVKMDVEGFEQDALEGMQGVISKYNPIIFCEIYRGLNSNDDPETTIKYLTDKGYNAFVLNGSKLDKYVKHDDSLYNYFFVHPEPK